MGVELDAQIFRVVPAQETTQEEYLKEQERKNSDKTLVIGIGGSGCQLLKRVYEHHSATSDLSFLAINSDYKELRLLGELGIQMLELKRSVSPVQTQDTLEPIRDLSMFNGQGAGGDPIVGKRMMQENIAAFIDRFNILENALEGNESRFCRVILLYGYGGGTGAGASLVIAEKLKEQYPYLELYGFVITPRLAGSAERMEEIVRAVGEMEKMIDVFIPIDQEGMYRAYRDKSQIEASAKLYDVALKNINAFLLVIGVPTEKNIDASDLARGLGVRAAGEERLAQCVIAGYEKGKLEDIPAPKGLENVEDSDLLRLLYAAVPGEFMYMPNVRGARVGIIKVVYGEDVCPSMSQLQVLERQVQALAKAAPGEFTLLLSYGPSKSVPKGEYEFAVFFSQFQGENKMPLSERMLKDYNKWRDNEKRKRSSSNLVVEFNTFRSDDENDGLDSLSDDDAEETLPVHDSLQVVQANVQPPRAPQAPMPPQQQLTIADLAQEARAPMAPIIEGHAVMEGNARRRMAAAQMETIEASRKAGLPMQRELVLSAQPKLDGLHGFDPTAFDPKQAAEAWQRWEREKGN